MENNQNQTNLNATAPRIKPITSGEHKGKYKLAYKYSITVLGNIRVIPAGFIFDGASIPRTMWTMLGVTPFHPNIIIPALVHDHLYSEKDLSREDADKIFKHLLEQCGFTTRATLMHTAVRWFGGGHWKKH